MSTINVLTNTESGASSLADINANFASLNGLTKYVNLNSPEGTMYNGRILPSVTSNNLTVALKTLAGTDPSASDPVYVMIGGVVRSITGALTITLNGGQNIFNLGSAELATKETDLFTFLNWDTTDAVVSLAVSRYPAGNVWGDFLNSATNEKGIRMSYVGTYLVTDPLVNIGRFAATLSAGAGYTWSVPTFTNDNLKQRPIYETRELNLVPTQSRTGTNYTNLPTQGIANYKIVGNQVFFNESHAQNGTPGGTGNQQYTLPFTPKDVNIASGYNNSSEVFLYGWIKTTGIVTLFKYDNTAEVTASQTYVSSGSYFI